MPLSIGVGSADLGNNAWCPRIPPNQLQRFLTSPRFKCKVPPYSHNFEIKDKRPRRPYKSCRLKGVRKRGLSKLISEAGDLPSSQSDPRGNPDPTGTAFLVAAYPESVPDVSQ